MIRRLVKTGLACALHWSGAGRLKAARDGAGRAPWIVGYHRVVEDFARSAQDNIAAMLIGRGMLERHLDWIGRRFRFVSLDEIGSRLERGETFDHPVAAITFDDGYSDVYHQAFPLLVRKGIPGAVFVVTDLIGTSRLPLFDRLHLLLSRAFAVWPSPPDELASLLRGLGIRRSGFDTRPLDAADPVRATRTLLEELPQDGIERVIASLETEVTIENGVIEERLPLTWEMLSEMRRAGFTIGSHTRTHPLLTGENEHKVLDETAGSRRVLEASLGIPIHHFAYPNGSFDDVAVGAVAAAGYRYAYTTCRHRDADHPLLTIPRTLLWENSVLGPSGHFSPALMSCQATGSFERVSGCRLDHGLRRIEAR
jgi:peptidoglycan/xylan/chitin deacetylase (PgdA/CDA1 family)